MRSTRKVATAAKACLSLLAFMATPCATARSQGLIHQEYARGNYQAVWTLLSLKRAGQRDLSTTPRFQSDEAWVGEYLEDPGSIYGDLAAPVALMEDVYIPRTGNPAEGTTQAIPERAPVVRKGTWRVQESETGVFPLDASVNRMIAWNLGLYKALPSDLRHVNSAPFNWLGSDYLGDNARFNLFKANIEPNTLDQSLRLSGARLSTLAAQMALTISTLSTWCGTDWDVVRNGARCDTLDRFWSADTLADLTEQDLTYLADILRMELSLADQGAPTGGQNFPLAILPVFRIARVAAAWHGSAPGWDACLANGRNNPMRAGLVPETLATPICFLDATDRAVYRWYRALRAHELAQSPDDFPDFDQASRLIAHFADVRPAWSSAFAEEADEWAAHGEIVEAQLVATITDYIGNDDDGAVRRLTSRAARRVCRSQTP